MLKLLCLCTALSFLTLQVKSLGNAPITPKKLNSPKVPAAPKEPSAPKAALNPSQSTVDANVDFNVEAGVDGQAPAAPKVPSPPKAPFTPKIPAAPKEPSGPKTPTALNPSQPTIDANVDFNVKAHGGCKAPSTPKAPVVPKTPSAPEIPAKEPSVPIAPSAPEIPASPKAPSAPKQPAAPEEPASPKAPSAPEEPAAAEKPAALEEPAAPEEPATPEELAAPKAPSTPEEPAAPKEPSAPKAQNTSCFESGLDYCWENYDGTVPPNALPASDDPEEKAYIGMVRTGYSDIINCTGTLIEKRVEMVSECYGTPKFTENIKILTVKNKAKWQWVKTSKKTFSKDIKDKGEPFISGKNDARTTDWFVGRVKTQDGTTEIGHISNGDIYFIHNNRKKSQNKDYDVLIKLNEKEPAPE